MSKGRVLIVDDQTSVCQLLSISLEDHGYITHAVSDAERAYADVESFNPDAILLDINMPDIDGIDLMMLLKGYTNRIRNRPIIFISALPAYETADRVRELGAADYLEKPFTIKDVLGTLERHMK